MINSINNLKILTIVSDLGLGGTQRVAINHARAYAEYGIISYIFSIGDNVLRKSELNNTGVHCYVGFNGLSGLDGCIYDMVESGLDVIHIHREGYADPIYEYLIKKILLNFNHKPLIIETNIFSRPDYSQFSHLIDIHMHLSYWGLSKWRGWTNNSFYYPIGIVSSNLINKDSYPTPDQKKINEWRENYCIDKSTLLILRVGQPIDSKWSWHAFNAFVKFSHTNKNSVFVVIGLPDSFLAKVKILQRSGYKIIIVEPRFDDSFLACAYAAADVFLHSSKIGESFGMVLAEAQLFGTPVISLSNPFKDNGHSEIIKHDETGFLCNTTQGMVDALIHFSNNPALRKKLGNAGIKHVLENYSKESVIPKILSMINSCLLYPSPNIRRKALYSYGYDENINIQELVDRVFTFYGKPNAFIFLIIKVIHNPLLYRLYLFIRNICNFFRNLIYGK